MVRGGERVDAEHIGQLRDLDEAAVIVTDYLTGDRQPDRQPWTRAHAGTVG